MTPDFTADFFRGNREKLRTLFMGTAPIVLTANGRMQRAGEVTYPFRQDSSFWYLTGIDEPDVILVLDKGKEYLIAPARETYPESFDPTVLAGRSGITEVLDEKQGWKKLEAKLGRVQHVATLAPLPVFDPGQGLYTNPARANLVARIKAIDSELELLDLRPHLSRMRVIKQPIELEAIQTAVKLTGDIIKHIHRGRQKYAYEYEIEAVVTAELRKHGVGQAYHPILAAGVRACTLQDATNNGPVGKDDLLLLDIGAEVGNYAATLTRTFPINEPTKRQRTVIETVQEVQEFAKNNLRPGVFLKEYEALVEQFMGEKLRELGLIKLIEKEEVRTYSPHAASHFLGLDVHDIGDYHRQLEAGMVLSVGPGIYIPEENMGVRIEDNVLITSEGIEVLSQRLPATL